MLVIVGRPIDRGRPSEGRWREDRRRWSSRRWLDGVHKGRGGTRPKEKRARVHETYCRLKGRWTYCYRAIDQDGQVVDVYVSNGGTRRPPTSLQQNPEGAVESTGATTA